MSGPITERITLSFTSDDKLGVERKTVDLYRYFDATAMAEFLFDRLANAVEHDLSDELSFLTIFDRAMTSAREIVDMPDRHLSMFVRLVLQNDGHRSLRKRGLFEQLTDEDVEAMETAIRTAREACRSRRFGHQSPDPAIGASVAS